MAERRLEPRKLCADMVEVSWDVHTRTALLEDISCGGACLQFEAAVPEGVEVTLRHRAALFRGTVKYCVFREFGYFVGVEFQPGSEWVQSDFEPDHLVDLEDLVRRAGGRQTVQ